MKILHCFLAFILSSLSLYASDVSTASSPRVSLSVPLDYQVVQRSKRSEVKLIVAGTIVPVIRNGTLSLDAVEARLTGKSTTGDLPGNWQPLPFDPRVAAFRGELLVPSGGWYRLEVRALERGTEVSTAAVEHVGIGEVFIVAGQSNAANYGEERQTTRTRLVSAFDGTAWQVADDPQPGAGGTKGSFMPAFGDALAERLQVPIGIVAVGIGSTSVREWLPSGTRIANLPPLTRNVVTVGPDQWEPMGKIFNDFTTRMKLFGPQGFRAVLWHQGESDGNQNPPDRSLGGSLYRQYLEQLILDSRKETGWNIPWFVAQASSHGAKDSSSAEIRAAQKALWDAGTALAGPDTDALAGDLRERSGQGVHFSGKGLREHGRLWAEKVGPWVEHQLATTNP
jgi:hypothetical protein